jgi:hypothetical protein
MALAMAAPFWSATPACMRRSAARRSTPPDIRYVRRRPLEHACTRSGETSGQRQARRRRDVQPALYPFGRRPRQTHLLQAVTWAGNAAGERRCFTSPPRNS